MAGKSFYDLEYIIEINEQRLEQYTAAGDKVKEKLTNIIVIYSAMAIFLVPIVRMVLWQEIRDWLLFASFGLFSISLVLSVFYTVRLVIPRELVLLNIPNVVYGKYRTEYEKSNNDRMAIEDLLKGSYISELEIALVLSYSNCRRKYIFYKQALVFALLSLLPFLICLGYYLARIKVQDTLN